MRDEQRIWQMMSDTSGSIYPLAEDIMSQQIEKYFTERRFYTPTLIASGLASQPLSVELYSKRNPYTNPAGIEKLLTDMTNAGYLEHDGKGGYVISEKGKRAIGEMNDAFYQHINGVNQFPADKLQELTSLLDKLVEACVKADLINGTLCLDISRNGHPKVETGSLAQVDQQLDDLHAFRDDSHISSWISTGVNGHTWETFSFVWNGEANTVEKLVERLPYRNYTAEDYAKALEDLSQRGWIEPGGDSYRATDAGKRIREDAETATDNNHFSPWKILTDDELANLGKILNDLRETNLKIVKKTKTG